eukprot:3934481-Rhodomonas_salina.6
MCGNYTGTCENVLVIQPVMSLSSLMGEGYYNRVLCDMVLVVPRDAKINIRAHNVALVAEDVDIADLTVTGIYGAPKNIEVLTQRLRVAENLALNTSSGRVVLHELDAKPGASIAVFTLAASVDITATFAPASLHAVSINRAVCLAGPLTHLSTEVVPRGNHTAVSYASVWECPLNTNLADCEKMPRLHIECLGTGAIGFHLLSTNADGQLSERPVAASKGINVTSRDEEGEYISESAVYAGFPFTKGYFTQAKHPDQKTELAIITLSGPGIMDGRVQVMWTRNSIWFAYPTLWVFWALSFTIVSPENPTAYAATIGFCPSHGPMAYKDLFAPIQDLMIEVATDETDVVEPRVRFVFMTSPVFTSPMLLPWYLLGKCYATQWTVRGPYCHRLLCYVQTPMLLTCATRFAVLHLHVLRRTGR